MAHTEVSRESCLAFCIERRPFTESSYLDCKRLYLIVPPDVEPPEEAIEGEEGDEDVDNNRLGVVHSERRPLKVARVAVDSKGRTDDVVMGEANATQVQRRSAISVGLYQDVLGRLHTPPFL